MCALDKYSNLLDVDLSISFIRINNSGYPCLRMTISAVGSAGSPFSANAAGLTASLPCASDWMHKQRTDFIEQHTQSRNSCVCTVAVLGPRWVSQNSRCKNGFYVIVIWVFAYGVWCSRVFLVCVTSCVVFLVMCVIGFA